MKAHDLLFISHDKYHEIICDHPKLLTLWVDQLIGIKYYCTEYSELDPIHIKTYVFEVVDPKKLMLFKFKYEF